MKFFMALWLSKLAQIAIKYIDRDRGTDFPGKIAYKIDKNFMLHLKNIDSEKIIFVTGSNGKSTITNLLYHTFQCVGKKAIANLKGSNMLSGTAACLIASSDWLGRLKAEYIVIEADERSFQYIIKQLPGKNIIISNIMQDQVHRNGDPDFIYKMLRKNISPDMTLFLNNDEPRSKSFEDVSNKVYYFGVDKNSASYKKDPLYDVTMPCPYCFGKIVFEYLNSANIGQFQCTQCAFQSGGEFLTQIENIDFEEKKFTIRNTLYPITSQTPIMLYNYACVSAVCHTFGLSDEQISRCFETFINVEGRMDILHYHKKEIKYIRIKQGNPETIQMAIDTVALDKKSKLVVFGMCIIPERRPQWVPHYTNTYYAYESNFKPLFSSAAKMMIFSDHIALDQVNRLIYDGFCERDIAVVESEDPKTVLEALALFNNDNIYLIAPLRNIILFKAFLQKSCCGSVGKYL